LLCESEWSGYIVDMGCATPVVDECGLLVGEGGRVCVDVATGRGVNEEAKAPLDTS